MALTQFGEKTRTLFLKSESHKLHHAFEAAAAIKAGQPVKLNADGTIIPAVATEPSINIIGYSIHTASIGDVATVMVKPYLIVWAEPKAAVAAGPVAYDGQAVNTDFISVKAEAVAGDGSAIGFALDQSIGADETIRVALF